MYIHKRSKNFKIKILDKLNEVSGNKEVAYWRKDYIIHDWFEQWFGEMENCKEYVIDEECLKELIKFLTKCPVVNPFYPKRKVDIKLIKKILDKTDFKDEELSYYAWW